MFNAARLVGPAIAGFLIAMAGEWLCFLLNAVSYVAVLAALLAMRVAPRASNGPPKHVLLELKDGFLYAFGFRPIRVLLLLLSIVSLAAMPLLVLMPIFATNVLHGGPKTLGLLTAAIGVGALAGALLIASRKTVLGLGRQIAWSSIAFGVCVIAFSFSSVRWISLVLLAMVGFSMMMETAATNTILQNHRGRGQTRTGNEFLCDGLRRHGTVRKPIGGELGQPNWCRAYGAACRSHVRCRRAAFYAAVACSTQDDPADLSTHGNSPRIDLRDAVSSGYTHRCLLTTTGNRPPSGPRQFR